jgi:hypothetical protein
MTPDFARNGHAKRLLQRPLLPRNVVRPRPLESFRMSRPTRFTLPAMLALASFALLLAGCAHQQPPPPPEPAVVPTLPPSFPAQQLIGRWGLAAYHNEADRARTVAAAPNQCRNPYVITPGPNGGVMMHLADQATPSELRVKGAPGGKDYVGPPNEPPGSMDDRQVVQFDGRVLILRWVDPEVQGRYGTMVYVRCPEGKKPARKPRRSAKRKAT